MRERIDSVRYRRKVDRLSSVEDQATLSNGSLTLKLLSVMQLSLR